MGDDEIFSRQEGKSALAAKHFPHFFVFLPNNLYKTSQSYLSIKQPESWLIKKKFTYSLKTFTST